MERLGPLPWTSPGASTWDMQGASIQVLPGKVLEWPFPGAHTWAMHASHKWEAPRASAAQQTTHRETQARSTRTALATPAAQGRAPHREGTATTLQHPQSTMPAEACVLYCGLFKPCVRTKLFP